MIPFSQDGKQARLPLSAIRGLANSPSADVRRRAYEAELAAYPSVEIPMAACLNGVKGEALTLCELRITTACSTPRSTPGRMDRATLDALLGRDAPEPSDVPALLRLKARLLGYDGGLKFYDLSAPVGDAGGKYTLEEARALLVDVMGRFSPQMPS